MHENLTYQINGCLFTVYNQLKNIWEEKVYEQAFELQLQRQGLQAETQKEFEVFYFGKRVGKYYIDVLVEDTVIVELKAVPEVLALHKAQLISYLKGYNKPLGILANFGEKSLNNQTFPNKFSQKTPLTDTFDFNKIQLKGKEKIKELLIIANRILITLGVGYFHQVYRRAFYYELEMANIDFKVVKEVTAIFNGVLLKKKQFNLFVIGDLLLSVKAVQKLDPVTLSRFSYKIKYLNCNRGLIFNFNAVHLDYRYFS